jgi:uncharacterized protein
VSKTLPSRERALQLLFENGCSVQVMNHCRAVAELALETAELLKRKGLYVDLELVEIGALLHDIGRSRTHSVHHVIEGIAIARQAGLPDSVVAIIQRHVGGGVLADEAKALGWPNGDSYVPVTLEEKIVSYTDKLIENGKRVPVDRVIEQLYRESKPEAAERVRKLHEEITALLGDPP